MQKTSSIYTKHATLHLSITQEEIIRQQKIKSKSKSKSKMAWKESNEFMKKVDKIKMQKRISNFLHMWCTHVSEKNRTFLDFHNCFAN